MSVFPILRELSLRRQEGCILPNLRRIAPRFEGVGLRRRSKK